MAPIGNNEGILFISFHADILGGTFKAAQSPGHQLILAYEDNDNLIEVTADGARINWERSDYRLSPDELSRILHKTPVAETVWHAIDLHGPDLFVDYRSQLNIQMLFIFSLYALFTLIMSLYLRRAERLRQAAEAHKDEFLSAVSHELRTPLTVIHGALGLIAGGLTGDITEKTKDLAQKALANTQRLTFLVNDLLDVQKIEAGKMEYHFKAVALKPFLERCIAENKLYGAQHNARYTLHPIPDSARVNIDENRIAQVLANLLSNAAKYGATEDNIDVRVEDTGDSYKIAVADHGKGIPQTLQQRLFEKFSQGDSGNTRATKGTGLGLYLARRIVEQHGCTIGYHSTESGTTFYFHLPKAV